MKLLVIHLSDIHIRHQNDFILSRSTQIVDAVKNVEGDIEGCILVITGDVAFSGLASEYILAEQFLKKIQYNLIQCANLNDIQIIFVPGNHDCNFSADNQVREVLIESMANGSVKSVSDSIVNQVTSVQDEFWNFVNRIKGNDLPINQKDKLCKTEIIVISGKRLAFHTYNTAWMSQKNEIQANLIFPENYMAEEDSASDLVVAMFHHPFNWLEASNARMFKNGIERKADLILTGHEHEAGQYLKSNRISGWKNEYIEGGVLQDSKTKASAFNAIVIDLERKQQKFIQCIWNEKLYETNVLQATWQDFQRNANRIRNEFTVSGNWIDVLTSPGAGFTNSRREQLELNDIFVDPYVRELTRIETMNQVVPTIVRGEQLWQKLLSIHGTVFFGEESSGKTTLAKNLFNRFHSSGFIPVFMSGNEIRSSDRDRLLANISKAVENQYSSGVIERFLQLNSEKPVLLIDNYHLITLNKKGINDLFGHLQKIFHRIVLFTNDLSKINEISVDFNTQNPLSSFHQFEIQEFGNQLKEELIEKWLTVGQEFSISEVELETQIVDTKRLIDNVLGRNLLPSSPIFILIVLQQIEAQTNLTTGNGSLGYFYEHLISTALSKTAKRLSLDTAYAFLSEVAQFMFQHGVRGLSEIQMQDVHRQYCVDYKMTLRFDVIEKTLVEADLLSLKEGIYSFKYKYAYYYFAARHLKDRLSATDGKEQLRRLAEHVYKEEFANILIFLTYLSKEPIIIEEMLRASRSIYPDAEICDFSSQMDFITLLHDQFPRNVLVDKDSKSTRQEINQALDQYDADNNHSDDDADLNDALRINVAFKTIQILGQLLKNFSGSIKGDPKLEIANECYLLGLRTLRTMVSALEPHMPEIVSFFAKQLEKFESDPEVRIKKARQFVSLLIESIALSFIKKISGSVGSESLRLTYDELVKNHNSLSVRLIDLSIKLDHFQRFPDVEFDALIQEVGNNNFFGTLILQHLAFDHFYRYPVDRAIKQSYCTKLGIEFKKLNLLDYTKKK